MAVGKEIRTQIVSVKNTQKITKAMEMVAASKMRKAQERMRAARPYAEKMRTVVAHVANANTEYKHSFLSDRPTKRVGVIVVSTDRGLCGGLNGNLFRSVLRQLREWEADGTEVDLGLIGSKAIAFFGGINANVVGSVNQLGDSPALSDIIGAVKIMLNAYHEESVDRVYIASNKFENSMTQTPHIEQLLPLVPEDTSDMKHHWDYIYEPEAKEVMDQLFTRYIESLAYQGIVENIACEQAARMVAMKSASDNAGDLIDELQLVYNKARQAAITQELSEIVAGAAAV